MYTLNLHVFRLSEDKLYTAQVQTRIFSLCNLATVPPCRLFSSFITKELMRQYDAWWFGWFNLFPSQTALLASADIDSASACLLSYAALACGSKHHQPKISCQAIVAQICSMCRRNAYRTKAVACCISEAGEKLSFLPPVPQECWCVNWGVTAEHKEHECEEFLFPKSLAGACKHTYCTCNLPWGYWGVPDITQVLVISFFVWFTCALPACLHANH